uniref:Uncharacterized protein n=1 Tax=Coccolithus braarudii TaxID=221442 RepID=A0A7S0LL54_9EUKA|mmetsp:Transcript_41495/g.88518  ORF Transcript_41495/g.88518 Transcript_41495/m.88518 type:complete len:207 (+) Transcript_41495:34-654(+)|eukprot:CAMPEP_0183353896 /NCGR_PEP_ID=MMETSP0164_2-20130417/35707_1 /TAXON_ID=221442 /ORGANISM="Coccolithus pelagicus ssp braarudi, Strain PLY182g" /LENGTH=206 /DNA_ID=CAMNT_0025526681 /DNA_START=30 /DNA_END=650 /DNA_ORIENTATION=-
MSALFLALSAGLLPSPIPLTRRQVSTASGSDLQQCRSSRSPLAAVNIERKLGPTAAPAISLDMSTPINAGSASVWLEPGPLPRLCIVAHDPPMTDAAVDQFLGFLEQLLVTDGSFSVLWDCRGGAFPSMKQFRKVIAFMNKDNQKWAHAWDAHVVANAILIKGMLQRGILKVMAKISKPPQPLWIGVDEDAACAFAHDCVKAEQDR